LLLKSLQNKNTPSGNQRAAMEIVVFQLVMAKVVRTSGF